MTQEKNTLKLKFFGVNFRPFQETNLSKRQIISGAKAICISKLTFSFLKKGYRK